MKQILRFSVLSSLFFLVNEGFAVPTLSGEVNSDEFFSNGVLLEDVELPSDPNATSGVSSVTIEGTGSVTVGNQRGGGFPRLTVLGGTKIESKRTYDEEVFSKTWWDGQFTAPGSTRLPEVSDVTFDKMRVENSLQVVEAFTWGLSNEEFTFSPEAKVVLPVDEIDGQKLWVAFVNRDDEDDWTVNEDKFCIVENGLCFVEIGSVKSLALVKELFVTCTKSSIENGKISNAPTCIVSCNNGYELTADGNACQEVEIFEETLGEEEVDENGEVVENFEEFEEFFEEEEKVYEFPSGYFRYQGASDHRFRYLDEEGLTGEALERVRSLNRSYLTRNHRTADEQVSGMASSASKQNEGSEKDSFLNYLLQMRNSFGAGKNANVYNVDENGNVIQGQDGELIADTEEGVHSSAPLLPSTGPEIFAIVAILGLLMMLFGARRRN